MRFRTRFDRWLVVLLVVAAAGCLSAPGAVQIAVAAIWAVALGSMLPQYYEIRGDALFIRQGWRKRSIPYPELIGVSSAVDSRSAGVFSSQRLLLTTRAGKRILIPVAEEERLLEELARRCPQLEKKPFGLGMPFSSSS
ncbi:MAG TPA: PH domain-containing protein [Bryobacteraceae bacterium]|nr:PH domain-containing protein [Bryobacteraceae bacterium]